MVITDLERYFNSGIPEEARVGSDRIRESCLCQLSHYIVFLQSVILPCAGKPKAATYGGMQVRKVISNDCTCTKTKRGIEWGR